MHKKTRWLFLSALALGLVTIIACTPMNPHPMSMESAVQNAKTRADHEDLAKHYEEEAGKMQTKVEEHKKLLAHYEREHYLYAKQWPSMAEHCRNLIRFYEGAAQENRQMAKMHQNIVP